MKRTVFPAVTIAIFAAASLAQAQPEGFQVRPYTYSYGDTVTAMDSEEFVICSGCRPDTLTKLPKQNIAIRVAVAVEPESKQKPVDVVREEFSKAPEEVAAIPVAKATKATKVGTVLFRLDSHQLQKKDKALLDKIVADLPDNSTPGVAGYTCTLGTNGHNKGLSQRRATAVANYLRTKGVLVSNAEGKGSCCAVSTEKKLNRRVDIEINRQ